MRIKFLCGVLLLVFIYGALAEQESNKTLKELELDIQKLLQNVSRAATMCNATLPCENGGQCVGSSCRCLKGTSGPWCKTIDDCNFEICGNADCFYNVTAKSAYCKCNGDRWVFDDKTSMCRECYCGVYGKNCSYEKGKKMCTCYDDFEDQLGTCTLCHCLGQSSTKGCHFDDSGNIQCNCLKGYAPVVNQCLKCDCGDFGKCRFNWLGHKTCDCDKGYVKQDGVCQKCDCGQNGTCSFDNYGKKECRCDNGFQIYEGTCKDCNCGPYSYCEFDRFGNKECSCVSGYGMKNEVCTRCDCYPGTSCRFTSKDLHWDIIDKECICPYGYANERGSCVKCSCGLRDSNCTMVFGTKQCECPKGYEAERVFMDVYCEDVDECASPQDNDCPSTTKCVNKPGTYVCACKEGYEVPTGSGENYNIKKFGCQDIDECIGDSPACIMPHSECVNTPGSFKCECIKGYVLQEDGLSERYNWCSEADRPWRTASIVIGSLFSFVILGLLIAAYTRYRHT